MAQPRGDEEQLVRLLCVYYKYTVNQPFYSLMHMQTDTCVGSVA